MKHFKLLPLPLFFVFFIFFSCKKNEDPRPSTFLTDSLKLSNLRVQDSLQRIIQQKNDSLTIAKAQPGNIIFTVSTVNGTNMSLVNGRTKSTQGLAGISVTVAQSGILKTIVTDITGQAVFPNMSVGTVAINVAGTGFTTVNVVAILAKPAGSGTSRTYASTIVPVYSTTASLALVSGRVFGNLDNTNTTDEKVGGRKVIARLDATTAPEFLSDFVTVQSRGYESVVFTNVTSATGDYTFSLPTGSAGNALTYTFDLEQFIADQKTGASTSTKMKYSKTTTTALEVKSEGIYSLDLTYTATAVNN